MMLNGQRKRHHTAAIAFEGPEEMKIAGVAVSGDSFSRILFQVREGSLIFHFIFCYTLSLKVPRKWQSDLHCKR
jgi:hypothetical protein